MDKMILTDALQGGACAFFGGAKPETLKNQKNDHPKKVEQSNIFKFSEMPPQGLRKVSVGQKPHKHDFPKIEI